VARRYPSLFGRKIRSLSPVAAHVARVRRLFPDRAEEVSRLALRNEAFRSLCEDYGMAVEALDLLETRNSPRDVEKMIEYRALIKELEDELTSELLAASPQSEPS
jgi:hypothetical protein